MAVPKTTSRAGKAPASANGQGDLTAFTGPVRLGRRTKHLVKRLRPEDVAIIDHAGIDRVSGEDLVASGVRHVVNVSRSASEHYANQGPLILTESGVHLVDMPGADLFDRLGDGDTVTLRGASLIGADGEVIAEGTLLQHDDVAREYEAGRREIGDALEAFAENTIAHIREERELLAGHLDLPDFDTDFRDRSALVVVRGVDHKKDLRMLRPYVRDAKPVLVAVDGGADAIIEEGFCPDLIVGDMDSATDAALRCGAELVVHAYPDGRAPGRDRLDALGLPYKVVPAPATSEDVALLIAAEKGSQLIVTVGSHFNLVEFLDKARDGMSSTFLTRLRVGELLVDAKGVSRLYNPGVSGRQMGLFFAAALVLLAIVIATTQPLNDLVDLIWLRVQILVGLK